MLSEPSPAVPVDAATRRKIAAWLDWYERRLCRWLPASEIRYLLRPVKSAPAKAFRAGRSTVQAAHGQAAAQAGTVGKSR